MFDRNIFMGILYWHSESITSKRKKIENYLFLYMKNK